MSKHGFLAFLLLFGIVESSNSSSECIRIGKHIITRQLVLSKFYHATWSLRFSGCHRIMYQINISTITIIPPPLQIPAGVRAVLADAKCAEGEAAAAARGGDPFWIVCTAMRYGRSTTACRVCVVWGSPVYLLKILGFICDLWVNRCMLVSLIPH